MAAFVTSAEPFGSRNLPSTTSRPAVIASRISARSMRALVTAIVGRIS